MTHEFKFTSGSMRKESHDTDVKWHVYEQCLSSNRIISILSYYAIFEIYAVFPIVFPANTRNFTNELFYTRKITRMEEI